MTAWPSKQEGFTWIGAVIVAPLRMLISPRAYRPTGGWNSEPLHARSLGFWKCFSSLEHSILNIKSSGFEWRLALDALERGLRSSSSSSSWTSIISQEVCVFYVSMVSLSAERTYWLVEALIACWWSSEALVWEPSGLVCLLLFLRPRFVRTDHVRHPQIVTYWSRGLSLDRSRLLFPPMNFYYSSIYILFPQHLMDDGFSLYA